MINTLVIVASLLSLCDGFSVPRASTRPSPHFSHAINRASRLSTSLSGVKSSNEDLLPGIAAINDANDEILEQLDSLRQTPHFRLYSVDILASCEYMPQELFECYSETCEVYPIDEEEVR
jgi:hypothetical protein